MSRRYSETAGMVEFVLDMGRRLSHAIGEGLPDDAKQHLLNAQRELITALVIMYEHQSGARRPAAANRPSRRAATQPAPKRPRSTRIPVE